jgi:hypothetical protein
MKTWGQSLIETRRPLVGRYTGMEQKATQKKVDNPGQESYMKGRKEELN